MITKPIKSETAFANGRRVKATAINVVSVRDNLFDHVIFEYTLFDENGAFAGASTFELKGEDAYKTWDASAEGAYRIVCQGIEVEFTESVGKTFFEA